MKNIKDEEGMFWEVNDYNCMASFRGCIFQVNSLSENGLLIGDFRMNIGEEHRYHKDIYMLGEMSHRIPDLEL